jgi:peroxiredoxin
VPPICAGASISVRDSRHYGPTSRGGFPEIQKLCAPCGPVAQQLSRGHRDKGGALAEKCGIRWKVPNDLKQIHKQVGADLEVFHGEDSWTLPMPARYAIGQDGVIAYAEMNPDYTRRPEPSDIFAVLDALRKAKAA